VIPTKNRPARLERSLACVAESASRLRGEHAEILVMDDASSEETRAVAERLAARGAPVRYFAAADYGGRGSRDARNAGVQRARGAVIAFTDDDTECSPEWLAHALARLRREPVLAGLEGAVVPNLARGVDPVRARVVESRTGGAFMTANLIVRRDAFLRVGGVRALRTDAHQHWEIPFRQDTDLGLRLVQEAGPVPFDPGLVVDHPLEDVGLSRHLQTAFFFEVDDAFSRIHPGEFPSLLRHPTARGRIRAATAGVVAVPFLAVRRCRRAAALVIISATAVQVVHMERGIARAGLRRGPFAVASSAVRRLPRSLLWTLVAGFARLLGMVEVRAGLVTVRDDAANGSPRVR
jgi:GT2 family glycosyltransferase